MKHHGVAYYPEAWPRERHDLDIRLMQEAGINLVRMGEFAWSRFEAKEGEYQTAWFKEVLDKMEDAGISVMMATPSAAPPAWMARRYPEILSVDHKGNRAVHGERRHYCPSSKKYLEFVTNWIKGVAAKFKDHEAVKFWQIDNEVAPGNCQCDHCLQEFKKYLQQTYGNVERLNEAWGNAFWSGDFSDWDEISFPLLRDSWTLEFEKFQSRLLSDFIRSQVETLRAINPDWTITTNTWCNLNGELDLKEMFAPMDIVAYDGYVTYHGSVDDYRASLDHIRCARGKPQSFLMGETGAWNPVTTEEDPHKRLRLWAFFFWAHGAEGILYFRWRQSLMGEEDHPGILDWSGEINPRYEQIKNHFHEIKDLVADTGELPLPECRVALLFDSTSAMLDRVKQGDSRDRLVQLHKVFRSLQVQCDIYQADAAPDLHTYSLVVCGNMEHVPGQIANNIEEYVRGGGMVLTTPRFSLKDHWGKYHPSRTPHGFHEWTGVRVEERWDISGTPRYGPIQFFGEEAFERKPDHVELSLPGHGNRYRGFRFMERLSTSTKGEILAKYESGAFAGEAAVTMSSVGKGRFVTMGTNLDREGMKELIENLCEKAFIPVRNDLDDDVDWIKRGRYEFYLNHSQREFDIPLQSRQKVVLGDEGSRNFVLKPKDVIIVENTDQ